MALDAALAYLHFTAILLVFAFLTTEVVLVRLRLDEAMVRLLGRVDLWYFGALAAALATGLARLAFGAKGASFYLDAWPVYVKIGLFLTVALVSVAPTLRYVRWRRAFEHDPAWAVPDVERHALRRYLMIEVHLAALIPVFAVIMARGLGH